MNTEKALEKDENSDNKPVQEGKSSASQQPLGDQNDLDKQTDRKTKDNSEDNDANSVGIRKD